MPLQSARPHHAVQESGRSRDAGCDTKTKSSCPMITHSRFTKLPMVLGMGPDSCRLARYSSLNYAEKAEQRRASVPCVHDSKAALRQRTQCSAPTTQRTAPSRCAEARIQAATRSRIALPHHARKVHQVPDGAGDGARQLVVVQVDVPARENTEPCPVCARLRGSIRSAVPGGCRLRHQTE